MCVCLLIFLYMCAFAHAGACFVGRRYVTATPSCRDIGVRAVTFVHWYRASVIREHVYAAAEAVLGTARVEHSRLTSLRTAVGDPGAYWSTRTSRFFYCSE